MADANVSAPSRLAGDRPVRWFAVVVTALALLVPALVLVPPGHAAPTEPRAITGTVTDSEGDPLADVAVWAYWRQDVGEPQQARWDWGWPDDEFPGRAVTDANGRYELIVHPDIYRLVFGDTDPSRRLLDHFHTDDGEPAYSVEEASNVDAGDGTTTPIIVDAVLDRGAMLSGTVSTKDGPAADVAVTPHRWHPHAVDGAAAWQAVRGADGTAVVATTSQGGAYEFDGLPAGKYRLEFNDNDGGRALPPAFYGHGGPDDDPIAVSTSASAATIVVRPPTETVLDDITLPYRPITPVTMPSLNLYHDDGGETELEPVTGRSPRLGDWLIVEGGAWDPSNGTLSYEWTSGGIPVGKNRDKYEPSVDDVGRRISVTVTATAAHREPWQTTLTTVDPVEDPAVKVATLPSLIGIPAEGGSLSVIGGAWHPASVEVHYQWLIDDEPVSGSDTADFTPRAQDVGGIVTVMVVALDPAGVLDPWHTVLGPAGPVQADGTPHITTTTPPVITGTAAVGRTLTITPGSWSPADVTADYVWRADGVPISGASGPHLTLTAAELGKRITAQVTAIKSGHASRILVTAPIGPVDLGTLSYSVKPSISGTPRVGETLHVEGGTWVSAEPNQLIYQWLVNGQAVPDGASPSFMADHDHVGKRISVRITFRRAGYHDLPVTTAETERVVLEQIALVEAPTFRPKFAAVGRSITVIGGLWDPMPDDRGNATGITFRWYVGDTKVGDGITWAPSVAHVDQRVRVRITVTDPDDHFEPFDDYFDVPYPVLPTCSVAKQRMRAAQTLVQTRNRDLNAATAHLARVTKKTAPIKRIKQKIKKVKQARKKAKQSGKTALVKKRTKRIQTKLRPKLKKAKQARKKLAKPRTPKPATKAASNAQRAYAAATAAAGYSTRVHDELLGCG